MRQINTSCQLLNVDGSSYVVYNNSGIVFNIPTRPKFEAGTMQRSHVWFRWFNEAPVLMMLVAVCLVVVKPF